MNRKAILTACAAAALASHLAMSLSFIRSAAPTYDEPVHLVSGYSYLATGKYVMNIMDHPPLAEMADALPLLLYRPRLPVAPAAFDRDRLYDYGTLFLYRNTVPAGKLLNTARIFSLVLWGGLFALFIWLAAYRAGGFAEGISALAIFSFMPVFISNDALVTTDAAPAVFFFAAFFLGRTFSALPAASAPHSRKHYVYAVLAGLCTGLGMASKFSMFIIAPLFATLLALHNLVEPKMSFFRLLRYLAVYLASALLALALVYKLDLGLYLAGLAEMFSRVDRGGSTFAWGHHSVSGVWWYFPLVLVVKTPLAVLALAAAGLASLRASFKREHLWLLLPPLVYFSAAMTAKLQLGIRHILPVMPFLAVLAGLGLTYTLRRIALRWVLLPLVLLWGWGLAMTGPHYLAYFNELAGGPANGYKFLVDSNLDWGQDVKALSDWLRARGNPPVLFSYFGVALPEEYGIKYLPFGVISNVRLAGTGEDLCRMDRLLLAVSATNLQSTYYYPQKNIFDWLKSRKPELSAGHSIFLYDLTNDRAGTEQLQQMVAGNGLRREADCLAKRAAKLAAAPLRQ